MKPSRDIARLIEIMAALRTPGTGCPWDLEQTFETIAPYTLEEAYEVADAIARGDLADLREELGDLLLQVVFHARMAQEQGAFDFGDVVEAITTKLIRRHPHVFGDARGTTAKAVEGLWERIKAEEKAERAARGAKPPVQGRSGGRSARPARSYARAQAAGQGRQGRASTGTTRRRCWPRSARRPTRSKLRSQAGNAEAGRRRDRRSPVCRGQPRPPPRCRSRGRVARDQPEIRAPLRRDRAARSRSAARLRRTPTLAEMDALWDAAKAADETRRQLARASRCATFEFDARVPPWPDRRAR